MVSSFNGRTPVCLTGSRGSIPLEIAKYTEKLGQPGFHVV